MASCLDVVFHRENKLILINFSYQLFLPWIVPLVSYLQRHHQIPSYLDFFMLSLQSFIVLNLIFSSVIYFELIFVKGIRSMSRFFFSLHVPVSVFAHSFISGMAHSGDSRIETMKRSL